MPLPFSQIKPGRTIDNEEYDQAALFYTAGNLTSALEILLSFERDRDGKCQDEQCQAIL